jgi:hypothetical protein
MRLFWQHFKLQKHTHKTVNGLVRHKYKHNTKDHSFRWNTIFEYLLKYNGNNGLTTVKYKRFRLGFIKPVHREGGQMMPTIHFH